jgi:hypothetical protein
MAECANGHAADKAAKYCSECGAEIIRQTTVPPPPRSFEPLPIGPTTARTEPPPPPPTFAEFPLAGVPAATAVETTAGASDEPRRTRQGRSKRRWIAGLGIIALLGTAAAVFVVVQRDRQDANDFEEVLSEIEVIDPQTESVRDLVAGAEDVFFTNWTADDDYDEFYRLATDWHQRVSALTSDYSTWAATQVAKLSAMDLDDGDADAARDLAVGHYQAWLQWSRDFPDVTASWAFDDSVTEDWADFATREASSIDSKIGSTYRSLCAALRDRNPDARLDRRIESICKS